MDLGTIQNKMNRDEYANENEFVADVRQIFINCYAYWGRDTPMFETCEKFERTFEEKYSEMRKWLAKSEVEESA